MRRDIFKTVATWNLILARRGKRTHSQHWPTLSVDPIALLGLPDCYSLLQMTQNISQKLLRWKQLLNLILKRYLWLFFDIPVTFICNIHTLNQNKVRYCKILFSNTLAWNNLT
jgi:hypothetical protein